MGTQAPFGVAAIKSEHDVATELGLSPPTCQMLARIATLGGEMPFDWGDFGRRRARATSLLEAQTIDDAYTATAELIEHGYLREREYVGPGGRVERTTITLTNKGRNVVAELERFKLTVGEIKPA